MRIFNRRLFLSALGASSLIACSGTAQTQRPVARAATALPSDLVPVPNAGFDAWVAGFRPRALNRGISAGTFDAAFANAGYVPGVVTRDRTQIQTRRTLEEYLSIATSDERIAKARAAFAQHAATLSAIANRYGVEAKIVAAIWGMESQFGEKRGQIPVVSSTATLAFEGRRGQFYESQLIAALRILERGDTTPAQLTGSWAGAMGHTQFIPTSYEAFAVDFTGDGRRDVWSDDPTDALASTAAYLSRNGWRTGLAWGAEAGVGLLADRIAGGGPLRGSFPPDANGLTKVDRLAIQRGLTAQGYDVGTIDGVIGAKTQAAIGDFQMRRGLPITNAPSRALVDLLR